MTTIILGQHPGRLDVRLVEGDAADLVGTLVDPAGTPVDWPAAPSLEFAGADTTHTATTAGPTATWSLTAGQVAELAALPRPLLVRLTVPDEGDPDGRAEYAGRVSWNDGWTSGDRTQRVTFTLPGGPPGPKGDKGDPGDVGVTVDHGLIGSTLTITEAGSHELDLAADAAVTVDTAGDVTIFAHGTGATLTVAGESVVVDGDQVVLVVTSPRGVQRAYVVGGTPSAGAPDEIVTATAPTFDDASGSADDAVVIPTKTGVIYRLGLETLAAGAHTLTSLGLSAGATVTITAISAPGYELTGTTSWEHAFSAAADVDWTTVVTDAFTGAGDLTGHVTSTGGRAWSTPGTTLVLDGDEAVWNVHGGGGTNHLDLGAAHTDGSRIFVDYRPGDVAAEGSRFTAVASINYTSTRYGNEQFAGVQLEMQVNGTMTLAQDAPGIDSLDLVGTLTGHPTTARLGLQILGLVVTVTLDGVAVATGTLPGTPIGSKIKLAGFNRSVAFDDLVVEAYE